MSELDYVPNFAEEGFDAPEAEAAGVESSIQDISSVLDASVEALKLSVCVGASYKNGKVCFNVPIYGDFCIPVPRIPVNASLRVCAQTCGSFLPTGLKISIYVNGRRVLSRTIVGRC